VDVRERGVGVDEHVLEMQRVVAKQAGKINCLKELVVRYERLSKETLKILHGLGERGTEVARERTLERLAEEVGLIKSSTGERLPGEPEAAARPGTIHWKLDEMYGMLEALADRLTALEGRVEDGVSELQEEDTQPEEPAGQPEAVKKEK
jgi:hypothetical protein